METEENMYYKKRKSKTKWFSEELDNQHLTTNYNHVIMTNSLFGFAIFLDFHINRGFFNTENLLGKENVVCWANEQTNFHLIRYCLSSWN